MEDKKKVPVKSKQFHIGLVLQETLRWTIVLSTCPWLQVHHSTSVGFELAHHQLPAVFIGQK